MTRTNFNSSRLVRLLAELSIVDAAESKQVFAERLGQWLDFSDAIVLHAAHSAADTSAAPSAGGPAARLGVDDELARVRTSLTNSITTSCSPDGGEPRIKWPTRTPGAAVDLAAAFAPYRRLYLGHQGDIESSLRLLRSTVQKTLARAGARCKQLATVDAALDKVLGGRERQLLATIPALLEQRFAQLHQAYRQTSGEDWPAAEAAVLASSGNWLLRFGEELQAVLLAELELRLQPTLGLIEALGKIGNDD